MKNFILNKSNKVYSLEELLHEDIKGSTAIKYEGDEEWTTAGELPELQEIIAFHKSYADIRPSNKPRVRKPNFGELLFLGAILPCIQLIVPIERDPFETDNWTTSVSQMSVEKYSVYGFIAVVILGLYIYNYFTYRYYRIVKMKEENNKKGKGYYQIQTCLSFQKTVDGLMRSKMNWKSSNKKISKKADAKTYFDKLTAPAIITETVLRDIKQRNKKPSFLELLKQRNSAINYIFEDSLVLIFAMLPIGFITFEILMILVELISSLKPERQELIRNCIFVSIPVLFLLSKLSLWNMKCYARVIKREIKQGLVDKESYHLQYFLSRKKLGELREKDGIKWKDKNLINKNHGGHHPNSKTITSEGGIIGAFHKQTKTIQKVTQVAMD